MTKAQTDVGAQLRTSAETARRTRQIVEKMYGQTRDEQMDEIRALVQSIIDDPNWCTANGKRAMVPIPLLRALLANNPEEANKP